jgi:hypothetical protein
MSEKDLGPRRAQRPPSRFPIVPLIGIALGVLLVLTVLRLMPRGKGSPIAEGPKALAGTLLDEVEGPLEEVLFHYVPRLEPLIFAAYRDFLGTLDPSTRLVAVVPAGAAPDLAKFLAKLDASGALAKRTRVVEVEGPISVWSKDRALVTGPTSVAGRTGLLIPVPPDPKWRERANDWRTLSAVAASMPERYYVNELPLEFDAGDFAVTEKHVIIDANLFTKNRGRGIESPQKLRELLSKLLSRDVVMLGDDDGDVPRHHLSMYMTPLGGDVVLVGDPRAGRAIVGDTYEPGEMSPDTGEPLRASFSDAVVHRYERAAKDLVAAGYRVVRIPTVPFDDKTYFAYTNGVYETRGAAGSGGASAAPSAAQKKVAWVPQYASSEAAASDHAALGALDEAARKVYVDLGWEVRPVAVRLAFPYHGTIGCLANVLARGPRPR